MQLKVHGITESDNSLRRFEAASGDLRPFWRELGERLADEAQRRWPLRRRTGRLRKSLQWAGDRLGRGGIFESSPDRLRFGTALFYSRFAQHGTKHQRATPLIHVNPDQHADQLSSWLRARAALCRVWRSHESNQEAIAAALADDAAVLSLVPPVAGLRGRARDVLPTLPAIEVDRAVERGRRLADGAA